MASLGLRFSLWAFSTHCGMEASHFGGFSCGAQALGMWASVVVDRALVALRQLKAT